MKSALKEKDMFCSITAAYNNIWYHVIYLKYTKQYPCLLLFYETRYYRHNYISGIIHFCR